MYKVMVVDDEKLIVQGLLNILEWDKLGLEVIQTAENGQDAFDKFTNNPVDIIVTDINMPKVTGLELIKKIKAINSTVKFVILSGYDEFSYAKEAMKYGVENYILKPINEEELEEALIKLRDSITVKKEKERILFEKNTLLNELINGKFNSGNLQDIKDFIDIDLNSECYSVASIVINEQDRINLLRDIDNVIDNSTKEKYELVKRHNGTFVVINSWSRKMDSMLLKEYYSKIKDMIVESYKYDVFIAIGSSISDINDIKDSYSIVRKIKKYILTEGTNICIDEDDVIDINEYKSNFDEEIGKLNKLIIKKNINEIKEYIYILLDDSKLTPKNIYDLSIKVIMLIRKVLEELKLEAKYSRDSLRDTIVDLCNESDRENIKKFLVNELDELVNIMSDDTVKYSPVIQQIITTVNERYYEELSLKTLAYQYNINSSYLGQVFTKEVGVSFSEYLNKTKNEKAKEFILNSNMKINDIAKAVGYQDSSYFYRKFKKYYGVCPSTLRELKNY